MDILTAKGQISVQDEQQAKMIFEQNFPAYQYIETPKNKPAAFDAVLVKDKTIRAIVETKCRRDMDVQKFRTAYNSEWLVTYAKLKDCAQVSDMIGVPLIGFLYIQPSNALLVHEIYSNGQFLPRISIERTETQATTNGGKIVRSNAYIDMKDAKTFYER